MRVRALAAMLACAALLPSCAGLPTASAASRQPAAVPAAVVLGVPEAPAISGITAGLASGKLVVEYRLAGDGGSAVTSVEASIDGGSTWIPCPDAIGTCTLTGLTDGKLIEVRLRAVNADGPGPASASVAASAQPPPPADPSKPAVIPQPSTMVTAVFRPDGNDLGVTAGTKLGVGALPTLTFSRKIPRKAVVETHLKVTATDSFGRTVGVRGSWGWLDERTVMFRPFRFWPGRSTIVINSTLDGTLLGKEGKNYLIGSPSLGVAYSFRTDRSFIAKVDGAKSQMRVFVDGVKVKTFGVSLGKSEWETRNGVKVISSLKEPTHTYRSTSLNITDPEQQYELVAPWNTRLTPTGEFIHAAPWATSRIGRYNGSHGCTNMFTNDAKWIYDNTIPGDVVLYSNTGGEVVESWNGPGGLWNIPWGTWLKKSALYSPTPIITDTAPPSTAPQQPTASA